MRTADKAAPDQPIGHADDMQNERVIEQIDCAAQVGDILEKRIIVLRSALPAEMRHVVAPGRTKLSEGHDLFFVDAEVQPREKVDQAVGE